MELSGNLHCTEVAPSVKHGQFFAACKVVLTDSKTCITSPHQQQGARHISADQCCTLFCLQAAAPAVDTSSVDKLFSKYKGMHMASL